MKVAEAFDILVSLKELKIHHRLIIKDNYQHCNFDHHAKIIKKLNKEIEILTECIYNQEMDDSYEQDVNLIVWKKE